MLGKKNFISRLKEIFLRPTEDYQAHLTEIEEALLTADVGVVATQELMREVSAHKQAGRDEILRHLKGRIIDILKPKTEFRLSGDKPFVIYFVGVNGVGKTTTIGKLAKQFKDDGRQVLMIAADTFRAAAVEQLKIWAERNGVGFFGGSVNADPASVIVDGLRQASSNACDIVLIDTAGRLHTKHGLMEELKKMVRMSEKELGKGPDEILLVVDAITGQNGFNQARVFLQSVPLTGVILTKYDATAKGGIIIAIAQETGLPIRYVGMGEGVADLQRFSAEDFVNKLFS